jgi:hypothetical protein
LLPCSFPMPAIMQCNKSVCKGNFRPAVPIRFSYVNGGIAQLVERLVRNEKARGSNPLTSSLRCSCLRRQNSYSHRRYRCLDERGDRTGSAGKTKVIVITAKRIWPRAAAMPAGPFHETVQRREILAIVHDALDRV